MSGFDTSQPITDKAVLQDVDEDVTPEKAESSGADDDVAPEELDDATPGPR